MSLAQPDQPAQVRNKEENIIMICQLYSNRKKNLWAKLINSKACVQVLLWVRGGGGEC